MRITAALLALGASAMAIVGCGDDDSMSESDARVGTETGPGDAGESADASGPCARGRFDGDYRILNAESLMALAGYTAVSGTLRIVPGRLSYPPALPVPRTLDSLRCLQEVGGDLIFGNGSLTSLDGLDQLTTVGGDLLIGEPGSDGSFLTNVNALSALTSVGGSVEIVFQNALVSLNGLSTLTSIGGSLNIGVYTQDGCCGAGGGTGGISVGNAALTSLDGLDGLASVGGDLNVGGNAALTNLHSLAALTELGGNLAIFDNSVLPTCEATLLDQRLVSLGWAGASDIRGNSDTGVCE